MVAIKDTEMPSCCANCSFDVINKCLLLRKFIEGGCLVNGEDKRLDDCPLVEIEPLTDSEQRIFLSAMSREEKICKKLDSEKVNDSTVKKLMPIVYGIERKVKKALWKSEVVKNE